MKTLSLFLCLSLFLAASLFGGEPLTADAPVAVGDKFEAQFVRTWFEVEVTEVLGNGDVKIRSVGNGPFHDKVVSKTSLRQLPPGVQADTPLEVGDALEANWGSRWHPVEVLEVLEGGEVKIRWTTFGPAWDQKVKKTTLRQREGVPLKDPPPPRGEIPLSGTTALKPGDKLRAKLGGMWGDVQVVEALASGSVAIRWPAFEEHGRQIVARTSLYLPGLEKKRVWTDVTGKFKIEAEFVAIEEGKLRLAKPDGKSTVIPLDKLSPEDQKVAGALARQAAAVAAAAASAAKAKAEQAAADPFGLAKAKTTTSPFAPRTPEDPSSRESSRPKSSRPFSPSPADTSPTEPTPNGSALTGEVLEKYQPEGCVVAGKAFAEKADWILEKSNTFSTVSFPQSPPAAYSVEVKLRREEGSDALVVALPIGQRHALAHLNSYVAEGTFSGLETGPKLHAAPTNAIRGLGLKNGQDYTLKCTVKPRHITVELDGRKIAEWEGDATSLTVSSPFLRPVRKQLGIGAWQSKYRLMSVKVEALAPTAGK